jgi:hypothetical protein
MSIEKPDRWKKAKSNTEELLENSKNAENLVGNIKTETTRELANFKELWKKTEETDAQPKIAEVSKIKSPVTQEISAEEGDIVNVKDFLENLSEETKGNLGRLRFNGMA